MKEISDSKLDAMLRGVEVAELPAGFSERIIQSAWALPQRKRLRTLLSECLAELLGREQERRWRLAGALAALLIGFSAGYYAAQTPYDDSDAVVYGLYSLDQSDADNMEIL